MKRIKNLTFFIMVAMVLIVLSACSDNAEDASGNSGGESAGSSEYPSTVTIGTASQGGTYYIWGGGLANLLEEHLDITSNVEVTGGPVHNIQLLDQGDIQIGMVTNGPLYEGYYNDGVWTNKEYKDIRVIFPMYHTPFHWWSSADSGATSIRDHEGERVGVGPAGGTPGTYNPLIYEVLGIETGDQVQAGASDMASQMLDGQLDHIGFSAGIPISSVTEVETQMDINIYGLSEEDRKTVMEELPYFTEYTIPADTYEQLNDDLETMAQFNFGVIQKDANEDFVYDFVKAYHENIDQMISTHASAKEAEDPAAILKNQEFPLHPGAIRYYEEIGIDLPEAVYPPEWEENNNE
ncbi:TAXI family TRAP transporter solute-binding subunit [Oceanobacillus senegalensis]|uniref:TAXI family TRAP transporter solute-binding subunit n=1 Tax=Oceanobacillus senegalensis TaxID=1936063 RepID=UPI000A31290C|nr:TAXI family TRAP transporter solute-binding subunit [Oceanobacillus senegalensis]